MLISSISEDANKIEEEIDKVEIEAQSTDKGYFLSAFISIFELCEHGADALYIVCCEGYEDCYADVTDDHCHHG